MAPVGARMNDPRTLRLAWSEEASPVLVPALVLVVLMASFLFVVGVLFSPGLAVIALFPLLVGSTWLFLRGGRRRGGGNLQLGADGSLSLQRGLLRLVLARDEVTGVLRAGPLTLRLDTRRGRQLRLGLDSEVGPDGKPVLDILRAHLALGSGQRALSLALRPTVGAFTWSFVVGSLLELGLAFAWMTPRVAIAVHRAPIEGLIVFAALLLLVPFAIAPHLGHKLAFSRLTVGEDGVLVERVVFRRLLRYRELARAELVAGSGIRLVETRGAEHVHHAFGQRVDELSEMVAHIRVQIARYSENAEPTGDALARGDRSIADWRRALGQLARGGGSFRQATLAPEVLHRIVVDAAAPLDRRVGAALALREVDPSAGARVRLAAEGTAEARVRLALEATLGADEQLDEHALDRATRAGEAG